VPQPETRAITVFKFCVTTDSRLLTGFSRTGSDLVHLMHFMCQCPSQRAVGASVNKALARVSESSRGLSVSEGPIIVVVKLIKDESES
jgi:hypothetical protein